MITESIILKSRLGGLFRGPFTPLFTRMSLVATYLFHDISSTFSMGIKKVPYLGRGLRFVVKIFTTAVGRGR
jgi:hypothetical protein